MINVTIGESKTQEKPFPKLMMVKMDLGKHYKNKGMIVYFKESKKGTVITNGENWGDGDYCECWAMESFTDYNEPITLQNA